METVEKIQIALFSLLGAYIGSIFSVSIVNPAISSMTTFLYILYGVLFVIVLAVVLDQLKNS